MRRGGLVKAEGAGNDFLVGWGDWGARLERDQDLVRRLCHRHRGVGADGALALSVTDAGTIRLVHRNSDGSRSAFCANGTRCAARVAQAELGLGPELIIVTDWCEVPAAVEGSRVTLELPPPEAVERLDLETADGRWSGRKLILGTPHLVIPSRGLAELDLPRIAPALRHHPGLGCDGANLSFAGLTDCGELEIRTWERGVEGETLCCGSGVVAAALLGLDRSHQILRCRPRSGDVLEVEALGEPPLCASRLTGPARIVARLEPTDELLDGPARTPAIS